LAGERHEHTLQPTALVHEAWLRIGAGSEREWADRRQFFAAAAEAMRRILVDRARRRLAAKRGAGAARTEFLEDQIPAPAGDGDLVAVSEAVERFSQIEPQKAELVKLRYFAGFTFEQAAEALGISIPTANRWWAYSRAWLLAEMKDQQAGGALAGS
jgi:RNA polymerase sigma factor (TIGR02999 family)